MRENAVSGKTSGSIPEIFRNRALYSEQDPFRATIKVCPPPSPLSPSGDGGGRRGEERDKEGDEDGDEDGTIDGAHQLASCAQSAIKTADWRTGSATGAHGAAIRTRPS